MLSEKLEIGWRLIMQDHVDEGREREEWKINCLSDHEAGFEW